MAEETALAHAPEAVVVNSFSKYFSMTGWRVGRLIVCLTWCGRSNGWRRTSTPPRRRWRRWRRSEPSRARTRSRRTGASMRRTARFCWPSFPRPDWSASCLPDGAFYLYVDVAAFTSDSHAFTREMLAEIGIAATPGVDFDAERGSRFVRFCYAGTTGDMAEAARRLRAWRRLAARTPASVLPPTDRAATTLWRGPRGIVRSRIGVCRLGGRRIARGRLLRMRRRRLRLHVPGRPGLARSVAGLCAALRPARLLVRLGNGAPRPCPPRLAAAAPVARDAHLVPDITSCASGASLPSDASCPSAARTGAASAPALSRVASWAPSPPASADTSPCAAGSRSRPRRPPRRPRRRRRPRCSSRSSSPAGVGGCSPSPGMSPLASWRPSSASSSRRTCAGNIDDRWPQNRPAPREHAAQPCHRAVRAGAVAGRVALLGFAFDLGLRLLKLAVGLAVGVFALLAVEAPFMLTATGRSAAFGAAAGAADFSIAKLAPCMRSPASTAMERHTGPPCRSRTSACCSGCRGPRPPRATAVRTSARRAPDGLPGRAARPVPPISAGADDAGALAVRALGGGALRHAGPAAAGATSQADRNG